MLPEAVPADGVFRVERQQGDVDKVKKVRMEPTSNPATLLKVKQFELNNQQIPYNI